MKIRVFETLLLVLFVAMLGLHLAMDVAWVAAGWETSWLPYASLSVGVLLVALLFVWVLLEDNEKGK